MFLFAKAALFKTQSSSAASRRLSLCMFLKSESESESESECDFSSASKAGDLDLHHYQRKWTGLRQVEKIPRYLSLCCHRAQMGHDVQQVYE